MFAKERMCSGTHGHRGERFVQGDPQTVTSPISERSDVKRSDRSVRFAMPGAPFVASLLIVVRPGAPSSILAPSTSRVTALFLFSVG